MPENVEVGAALKPVKANIQKWVDALRSGKYKQCTGQLHRPLLGSYCCLGVLCDVSEVGKWSGEDYVVSNDSGRILGITTSTPPVSVQEWVGLPANLTLKIDRSDGLNGENSASYVNDHMGRTFSEIADMIEAKYLKETLS